MDPLGTFIFLNLKISATNSQHANLVGDVPLVAQLSVNDELIEEVVCPTQKSRNKARWKPHFATELPIRVERFRITLIKGDSVSGPRALGFTELTGAEVFANHLSDELRFESVLVGDVDASPPLHLSFFPIFSFLDGFKKGNLTPDDVLDSYTSAGRVDFDFLHNATLLITNAEVKMAFSWHLVRIAGNHWDGSQTLAHLNQALAAHEDAVALTSDHHPDKAKLMKNLASFLHTRYSRSRDISDVRQAASVLEEALKLIPADCNDLRDSLTSFLGSCYRHLPDRNLLNQGVSILEARVNSGGSSDLNGNTELALALLSRFDLSGDIGDLDRSIQHLRRALSMGASSKYMTNLGNALIHRYELFKDVHDLNEAIVLMTDGLALAEGKRLKVVHANNLANCLVQRYDVEYRQEDITQAIELFGQIICQIQGDYPEKARVMNNWATAYASRHQHLGDVKDLEKAISILEEAHEIETALPIPEVMALPNLGRYLLKHFEQSHDPSSLHKAIQFQLRLIQLTPETDRRLPSSYVDLGLMYSYRYAFNPLRNPTDIQPAIDALSKAARMHGDLPSIRYKAAMMWAQSAQLVNDPSIMAAYTAALELLPQVAWLGLSLEERHKQLADLQSTGTITLEAAATAIEQEEFTKAVEWLEQGRSVVWQQLLQLRTPVDNLREAYPNFANCLDTLSTRLEQGSVVTTTGGHSTPAENQRQATLEWENLIKEIRRLAGFKNFLMPRTFERLKVAATNGPIILLNQSTFQCDALVLLPGLDEVLHIPLFDVTRTNIQRIRDTISRLLRDSGRSIEADRFGKRVPPPDRPQVDTDTAFAECLKELWRDVVKPVLDGLALTSKHSFDTDDLPRIWWCPTGPLSSLPLHAAGDYSVTNPGSKASDFVISSYIPTISSLLHDSNPGITTSPKILTIAQPSSIGQQGLPGTVDEVKIIAEKAGKHGVTQLVGLDATVEAVLVEMKEAHWVHFACHGVQSATRPTDSALLLADKQRLRLSEVIRMNLPNAQLAFLSACQTATGAKNLPDEAVHLAAGMLLAGYRGVIATMWSIADNDAPQVAEDVYGMLLEGEGVPDYRRAARALHFAVKKLREGYGNRSFLRWVPYIHIGS